MPAQQHLWFVHFPPGLSKNSKALAPRGTHHCPGTLMGSTGPKNQAFACQPPLQAHLSSQGSENCTQEANTWVLNLSTQHKRPLPLTPTQTPNSWVSEECPFSGLTPAPPLNASRPTPRSKDLISDLASPSGMGGASGHFRCLASFSDALASPCPLPALLRNILSSPLSDSSK